jgi:hypothetical protein
VDDEDSGWVGHGWLWIYDLCIFGDLYSNRCDWFVVNDGNCVEFIFYNLNILDFGDCNKYRLFLP